LDNLEYEINDITFTAKYFTNCAKGTPMWEIKESKTVYIPLIGLSHFEIKLNSDQPFHPKLILNNISIPLWYEAEQTIGESVKRILPPKEYPIEVIKQKETLQIY
ncbi:unnamed protein product, partial [Meganyctiphanes norvegica]